MPDEITTQPPPAVGDVVVDLPPVDGVQKMPVDPTIEKVLDQAYTHNHELSMQQANRENAGVGTLVEMSRASFSAAAVQQVHLASGILAQRSAQAQPQQQPGPGGTGVPAGMKLVPV